MEEINHSEYKTGNNAKTKLFDKAKAFFERHKVLTIIVGLIIIVSLVSNIKHSISASIENGKNFYITIQDEFSFDCEATDSDSTSAYCKERTISGNFSNYDTVKFDWDYKIAINGDTFTYRVTNPIKSDFYQTDNFDINNLPDEFDAHETIELRNKVLNKTVASKFVTVHYKLNDSDKQIISRLHDKWVAKEAQEEADKKATEEAAAKAEQEEQARQETETANTETTTEAPAEEAAAKAEQEEQARQETETANTETTTEAPAEQPQEQTTTKQDNGEELPDDISPYDIKALCERGFESMGYTNASIRMTNQYAMGYPPYIYVIVGTLSTKAGITSSRQQVGTIQCQANWNSWTIKHLTVNGTQIY